MIGRYRIFVEKLQELDSKDINMNIFFFNTDKNITTCNRFMIYLEV